MVIDYRDLNKITIPFPQSIPNFESLAVGLKRKYFSALDLSSAYHHLRLNPTTNLATCFRFENKILHMASISFLGFEMPLRFFLDFLQIFYLHIKILFGYILMIFLFSVTLGTNMRNT